MDLVKAIVLDLDNTTLHSDLTLSAATLQVFEKCKEQGIKLIIATARPMRCVTQFSKKIKPDAIVWHNGAAVTIHGKLRHECLIGHEESRKIINQILAVDKNAEVSAEMGDTYYANFDVSKVWADQTAVLTDFQNIDKMDSYKILANVKTMEEIKAIAEMLPKKTYVEMSEGRLALIMKKEATKLNGVKKVLEDFHITLAETAAFGDDYGDVELLRSCRFGIAVDNALPEVKAAAKEITLSNNDDGVAAWLSSYLLRVSIKQQYGKEFLKAETVREGIGRVTKLTTKGSKCFILKQYRFGNEKNAKYSAKVMEKLRIEGFKVPRVIRTLDGKRESEWDGRTGVLFEYVEGNEPDRDVELHELGRLCGELRHRMEKHPSMPPFHGKEFFVDRYLKIISEFEKKDKRKSSLQQEFAELADRLLACFVNLPKGFIHGDFHTGNMINKKDGIYLIDFDACAYAYPMMDIAAVCDATNYFSVEDRNFTEGLEQTKKNLKKFLKGYHEFYTISKEEERAVLAGVALRHFDIQATIIEAFSMDCVDKEFIKTQLLWITKWCEVCGI